MLKKIAVADLRLGMHLHGFDGGWMSHPFWRTRFLLDDAADLRRVRESAVQAVWIDTAKGLDVAGPASDPLPAPSASPMAPAPAVPAATESMAAELRRAAAVCKTGRAAVATLFREARLGSALQAEQCLPLVEQIAASVFRNPGALVSLARLKTHDDYSYMHSVAVCALMVSLARQLGMSDDACREAGLAGLLHDIGKALMPPEILNKPGRLTDAEYGVMKTHPERGRVLLVEAQGAGAAAVDVCLHHHEKIDGSGYPHGLHGEQISTLAKMGAVCDVYDAITSNRPYKAGWDPAESIARMTSWQGHFDPPTLAAFVRSIGIYPNGSLVRMASGKLALVVEQNAGQPAAPVLKLFFSTRTGMRIPSERLDLAAGRSADRIVGRELPQTWGFRDADEIWLDPDVRRAMS